VLESQKELFESHNASLLTINIDQEKFMKGVENFLNREQYAFPVIVNNEIVKSGGPDIDALFDVRGRTPFSYLVGKGGTILDVHWGAIDAEDLAILLDKLN